MIRLHEMVVDSMFRAHRIDHSPRGRASDVLIHGKPATRFAVAAGRGVWFWMNSHGVIIGGRGLMAGSMEDGLRTVIDLVRKESPCPSK